MYICTLCTDEFFECTLVYVRMYRFWDFDRDENYTIDVASVTPAGTTASSVTCVHADPNHGTCPPT